jgi:hypothetical protein
LPQDSKYQKWQGRIKSYYIDAYMFKIYPGRKEDPLVSSAEIR